MSRAIDGGLHSTANALRAGPRPTRQSRKKLIDARRQSGNPVMAFSDNQERHRKALRSFELKMIIARYRPPPQTLIAAAVLIQIVARHGSIRRVPAAEIEALVTKSVRERLKLSTSVDDRS